MKTDYDQGIEMAWDEAGHGGRGPSSWGWAGGSLNPGIGDNIVKP